MKQIFYLFAVLSFMVACSGPKGIVKIEPNGNEVVQEDSVEYELIVFDTGFETWYLRRNTVHNNITRTGTTNMSRPGIIMLPSPEKDHSFSRFTGTSREWIMALS